MGDLWYVTKHFTLTDDVCDYIFKGILIDCLNFIEQNEELYLELGHNFKSLDD